MPFHDIFFPEAAYVLPAREIGFECVAVAVHS